MNNFTTSFKGKALIRESEGEKLIAYLDTGGIPTIGVGSIYMPSRVKVKMGDTITQDESDNLFNDSLKTPEHIINELVTATLNQNKFDALVSWVFEFGAGEFMNSTLLKFINAKESDEAIKGQFLRWVHGMVDGVMVEIPGLVTRRNKEITLYFTPVIPGASDVVLNGGDKQIDNEV